MAYTQKEIVEMLNKIEEAKQELKMVTSEAHAAKRDLTRAVKEAKQEITDAINLEVARQLEEIVVEVRDQMYVKVDDAIVRIANDWRTKLGLPT